MFVFPSRFLYFIPFLFVKFQKNPLEQGSDKYVDRKVQDFYLKLNQGKFNDKFILFSRPKMTTPRWELIHGKKEYGIKLKKKLARYIEFLKT